jgi:hypothetical protein
VLGQALVAEKVLKSAFSFENISHSPQRFVRMKIPSSAVGGEAFPQSLQRFHLKIPSSAVGPRSAFSCETFSQSLQRFHLHENSEFSCRW